MKKYGMLYDAKLVNEKNDKLEYEFTPIKMISVEEKDGKYYDFFEEIYKYNDTRLYLENKQYCLFNTYSNDELKKLDNNADMKNIVNKLLGTETKKYGVYSVSKHKIEMIEKSEDNQIYILLSSDLEDILKTSNIDEFDEKLSKIINNKEQEKRKYIKNERKISITKKDINELIRNNNFTKITEKFSLIYDSLMTKYKNNVEINNKTLLLESELKMILKIDSINKLIKYISKIKNEKSLYEDKLGDNIKNEKYIYINDNKIDEIIKINSIEQIKNKIENLFNKKENSNDKNYDLEMENYKRERQALYNELFNPIENEYIDLPKKIYDYLNKKIIGQDEAKKAVIRTIMYDYQNTEKTTKKTCLLIGPTGSGKTLIVKSLSEVLDRPFKNIDSTQLSLPGLVGTSIENCFEQLYKKCGNNLAKAEKAIVLFDEIDKPSQNQTLGSAVYHNLLTVLESSDLVLFVNEQGMRPVLFNTSNLIIFAAGSFRNLVEKLLIKEGKGKNSKPMGFSSETIKKEENKEDIKYPKIKITDLFEDNDIPQEFIGRISTIVQLDGHTVKSLKEILTESIISPLLWKIREINLYGVQVYIKEDFLEQIAINALETKTGARSLNAQIDYAFAHITNTILLDEPGKYSSVTLSKETALDNSNYELNEYFKVPNENEKVLKLSI